MGGGCQLRRSSLKQRVWLRDSTDSRERSVIETANARFGEPLWNKGFPSKWVSSEGLKTRPWKSRLVNGLSFMGVRFSFTGGAATFGGTTTSFGHWELSR